MCFISAQLFHFIHDRNLFAVDFISFLFAYSTADLQGIVDAHNALGLRDLSRVDLIVGPDGSAQVLEANVAPGMTETSLLPLAVAAAGLDLGKVLATLVARAVERG